MLWWTLNVCFPALELFTYNGNQSISIPAFPSWYDDPQGLLAKDAIPTETFTLAVRSALALMLWKKAVYLRWRDSNSQPWQFICSATSSPNKPCTMQGWPSLQSHVSPAELPSNSPWDKAPLGTKALCKQSKITASTSDASFICACSNEIHKHKLLAFSTGIKILWGNVARQTGLQNSLNTSNQNTTHHSAKEAQTISLKKKHEFVQSLGGTKIPLGKSHYWSAWCSEPPAEQLGQQHCG